MKQIGDNVTWRTKYGEETGTVERVRVTARYIVRISNSERHVDLLEDVSLNKLRPVDPNAEFLDLVQQMRNAQRAYFTTKDADVPYESKRLEKKVDAFIELCRTPNIFNEHHEE